MQLSSAWMRPAVLNILDAKHQPILFFQKSFLQLEKKNLYQLNS